MLVNHIKWALLILSVVIASRADHVSGETGPAAQKSGAAPETAIHITADRLESHHDMSWVEFTGNVVATRDDIVIAADRMKVFYKPGGDTSSGAGAIEKIVSEGSVKIVFDNNTKTAVAEKAVYFADRQILELSGGSPSVSSGKNTVRGSKITLFHAENRSLVEGSESDRVEATVYVKNKEEMR